MSDALVVLVGDVEDPLTELVALDLVDPLGQRRRRRPADVVAVEVVDPSVAGTEELGEGLVPVHVALHVGAHVGQRAYLAVLLADDVDDALHRGVVERLAGGHSHLDGLRLAHLHQLDRADLDPATRPPPRRQRAEHEAECRHGEQRTDGQPAHAGADHHLTSGQGGHRQPPSVRVIRPSPTTAKRKAKKTAVMPATVPTRTASVRSPARHIGASSSCTSTHPATTRQTMAKPSSDRYHAAWKSEARCSASSEAITGTAGWRAG